MTITTSPITPSPVEPGEQPVLDALLAIFAKLNILKQDRSTYIKSHDVLSLFYKVIDQVHSLNEIRSSQSQETNRVDSVLDDCFQLISLFFMTIGRNNEAPAVYATLSTIKRLLDHLTEAKLYCGKDLSSISTILEQIAETVLRGKETYSPQLVDILGARLDTSRELLRGLEAKIADVAHELIPTHERTISILRCISAANTRTHFPTKEILEYQEQLRAIEEAKKNGEIVGESGELGAGGHEMLEMLLDRCLEWSDMVLERQGQIDDAFKPTYTELCKIRNELEKLTLTQAWALRETDLYQFQRQLDDIDEGRVDGNFIGADGKPADLFHQRTLLYLVRRSYAYIYSLMISSEPVSEALLPVFNQLQTLRRCLLEVKSAGGLSSPRELYPYSMKLNSLDNMRVNGRFMVGNDIPEGQGSIVSLLEECFDLVHDLRVQAESVTAAIATTDSESEIELELRPKPVSQQKV